MHLTKHKVYGSIRLSEEPIDGDLVSIVETGSGLVAVYPTQVPEWALQAMLDGELKRNDVIAVFYHRDLWITRDDVITKSDVEAWFNRRQPAWKKNLFWLVKLPGEKIPQSKKYHIFELSALIHGTVTLSLSSSFMEDPGRWDTSTAGVVLVRRRHGMTYKQAFDIADSFVNDLNALLHNEYVGITSEFIEPAPDGDGYIATEKADDPRVARVSWYLRGKSSIDTQLEEQIENIKLLYGDQLPLFSDSVSPDHIGRQE